MFRLLNGAEPPKYLNRVAQELFEEAQYHFGSLKLAEWPLVRQSDHTLIFPWAGDVAMDTLAALMTHRGIEAHNESICLNVPDAKPENVTEALRSIIAEESLTPESLASAVLNKKDEKYSEWLGEDLLCEDWASHRLDLAAGRALAQRLYSQIEKLQAG